uniref:Uncharacterized protein n=1 Tax=Globisporangium ultimum (strain ATCC 200006 / CBS 805.95 / DAOM BR144) TaxID=431595 RepID=K3W7G6_GLOUD
MGAGASTNPSGELMIGDVVTIQIPGHPKRVIGIVADIRDTLCSIQVSNAEIVNEVALVDVQRIACWSEIEDGDIIKVREKGSRLYHEATAVAKNDDGTFRVRFGGGASADDDDDGGGEDEIEDHVASERILKIMSGRLEQKEWMMYKETSDD